MKKLSKVLIALVFCISVLASTAMLSSAALDKVTGLTATEISVNKITLSWNAVSGAGEYQIRVYEGTTLKKTIDTNSTATTYTVTGLTPNKTYGFSVRAFKSIFNTGSYSSQLNVKTGVADIATLKATPSVTSVKLTWSKVADASGYIVERKSGSSWKTVKKVTSTSLTVSGLTPDTKYTFRVRAYVKYNGKTYYSANKAVSATPCVAVPKVSVSSTYNTATAKWSKLSGVNGYQIQILKNGKWSSAKKLSASTTSYKYSSLTTGTTYKIRVRAYQKATVSGKAKTFYSQWKTVAVKPALSTVSALKYSSLGTNSVKLTWTKVAGASGYKIYSYDAAKKAWTSVKTISSGTTTTCKLSIASGTSYKMMIKAYRKVSPTAYSAASSSISFVSVPATVTGLKATAGDDSIKLTWTKTPCAKYIVAYKLGSGSYVTKPVTTNSFSLTKLDGAQKYTFRVRAVNSAGANGEYSAAVSATTYGVEAKKTPTLTSSDVSVNEATLSWTKIAGAQGYLIYSYEDGKWTTFKKVTSGTSVKLTLEPGTTYSFRVKAYGKSSAGKTVYGTASATAKLSTIPAKVTGLTAITGDSTITLSWDNIGHKGYTVEYKLSSASAYTKLSASKNTLTIKNLTEGETYQIRVAAYNDDNKYGEYSDVASVKTYTGAEITSSTDSKISLSWTAVEGAAEYDICYYDALNDRWAIVGSTTGTTYTDSSSIKLFKAKLYRIQARDTKDDYATENVVEGNIIYLSDTCLGTASGFNVSVNNYAVTISWDPVADATGYTVYFYEIYNNTTSTTADGTQSKVLGKDETSVTYYLAPGSIRRVLIYANKESSKTVLARFAIEMPEITTGTTDLDKNAQILYLIQAVNNTKKDTTDYKVNVARTGKCFYEISYLKLAFSTGVALADKAIIEIIAGQMAGDENLRVVDNAILCETPEQVSQLMTAIAESEEETATSGTEVLPLESYTFTDGYSPLSSYSTKSLTSFLEPLSQYASYSAGQTPANWKKAFSSITAEKVNDNQTKITLTLKPEYNVTGTNSYHHGFFANQTITGSSANLDGIVGNGTKVTAESIGESKLIAVIDENNHLISYDLALPCKTHMVTSSTDKIEIPVLGEFELTTTFEVKLNTDSSYNYTFSEQ